MKHKDILFSAIIQIMVYVAVYIATPYIVENFGRYGDPFGGVSFFINLCMTNLLLVLFITVIGVIFFINKYRFLFVGIPTYVLMHLIYYPEKYKQFSMIGFGDFTIDLFVVMTLISQLISLGIVILIKKMFKT